MELVIQLHDAAPGALEDLRDRLARADELRGRVRLRRGEPGPEEMGLVNDAVTLAVETHAVPAVAGIVMLWIRQSRSKIRARVTREGTDRSVELDATNVAEIKDVEVLIRRLME